MRVSIVIPAKNEEASVGVLIGRISLEVGAGCEIIVVDDGSTDATAKVSRNAGARVISHPYAKGNGAAIKTGAAAASGDVVVFMDADGQHDPGDVVSLLDCMKTYSHDMVVGARTSSSQASVGRGVANRLYNWLASKMVGHKVWDLTSGFRIVRRDYFLRFLYLLPNGFSYPTTITMAFFRAGYSVGYLPIVAGKRKGKSHIHPVKDGVRFLLIIFKIGTLYSPLKIFFPISLVLAASGVAHYAYVYLTRAQFSNMSMLLFLSALTVFLVGLVSEQITALMYRDT